MSKRIEIFDNFTVITDTVTSDILFEAPTHTVRFRRLPDSVIYIYSDGERGYIDNVLQAGDSVFVDADSAAISNIYDWLRLNRVQPFKNYVVDVALDLVTGVESWHKFGHNADIDIGTETVWAAGGTFVKIVTAETLNVVSGSADDADSGTGAQTIEIHGVDENYVEQIEVVTMDGVTPVETTGSWLGVNRVLVLTAGSGGVNAGLISVTASAEATLQATIPIGLGITQQAIFFVQANRTALLDWIFINVNKISGGASPVVIVRAIVTVESTGVKHEIFRIVVDTDVENNIEIKPNQPFVIGEATMIEFQMTTDVNNTDGGVQFSILQD